MQQKLCIKCGSIFNEIDIKYLTLRQRQELKIDDKQGFPTSNYNGEYCGVCNNINLINI